MVVGKLEEWIAKLKTFSEQKVDDGLLKIVRNHKSQLIDLNTNQLMHGQNADGGVLGTYRSEPYMRFKQSLNSLASGKVDVRLTGDFQNSFFLEAEKFPVSTFATDTKTAKLTAHYEGIFGFTQKSKDEIVEDIKLETVAFLQDMLQV